MPLPSDEKLIALSQDLLKQFDTIFGLHPGFRPAHAWRHADGSIYTLSRRSFTNTGAYIIRDSTPVTARFPTPVACLRFLIMTPTQIRASCYPVPPSRTRPY
jgi:hypothetical protein